MSTSVNPQPHENKDIVFEAVHEFLQANKDIRFTDINFLHMITWKADPVRLELLFDAIMYYTALGVNDRDEHGRTPLHYSIYREDENVLRYLLGKGASPNVPNANGNTPLHLAAVRGYEMGVKILHECGGNLQQLNHQGLCVLGAACHNEQFRIMDMLTPIVCGDMPDQMFAQPEKRLGWLPETSTRGLL